jgi:hypothetical protein
MCDIVAPRVIVEVGSLGGFNSENLLAYCRANGSAFHVVDPTPIDPAEIRRILGEVGTFHQAISLDVLDRLPGDLILLDGDHNWFTVFHELRAIEACARAHGRPFPVVCLHDIGWPYGRRDLYYAPERIPAEYRLPHARRGLEVGRAELVENGGFNLHHDNALAEGGPRNGVLTAAEDFVGERSGLRLFQIPGFHGLGVLLAQDTLAPERAARLDALLTVPPHLADHLHALEEARLRLLVQTYETHWRLGGTPGPHTAFLLRLLRRIKRFGRGPGGP